MSGSTGPVLTSGGRWRSLADAQTPSSGVTQINATLHDHDQAMWTVELFVDELECVRH